MFVAALRAAFSRVSRCLRVTGLPGVVKCSAKAYRTVGIIQSANVLRTCAFRGKHRLLLPVDAIVFNLHAYVHRGVKDIFCNTITCRKVKLQFNSLDSFSYAGSTARKLLLLGR